MATIKVSRSECPDRLVFCFTLTSIQCGKADGWCGERESNKRGQFDFEGLDETLTDYLEY